MRQFPLLATLAVLTAAAACQCLTPVKEVPCGRWNCAGCCDPTGSCVAGTSTAQCGAEAAACASCIGAQSCAAGLCRDSSCLGCILPDGGCVPGDDQAACGSGGLTCAACGAGRCELKRCVGTDGGGGGGGSGGGSGGGTGGGAGGGAGGGGGGASLCNAGNCAGCCQGNSCITSQSSQRCGLNGNVCQACTNNQTCRNGQCVPRGSDGGMCGPGTCSGCCFQNQCLPGNQNFSCGTGGAACQLCSNGTTCSGGQCVRAPDGGRAIGAPCTDSSQCGASTLSFCLPGSAGWSQGYCTQVCMTQGADVSCQGNLCAPSSFSSSALLCLARCTADGGRGNCRQDYACQPRTFPDGTAGATCQPPCSGTNPCGLNTVCGDAGVCR